MHIIGMIVAPDGKIENASSSTIDEAVQNGFVLDVKQVTTKPSILSLFPNPANETASLLINMKESEKAIIHLCDINGKLILQHNTQLMSGSNTIPLSLKGLAAGNYLLSVIIHNEVNTIQFTKK
jgi:hypothetical protein